MDQEMMLVTEVAEFLQVPVKWVYRHAAELPFAKKLPGNKWRFSRKGLLAYVNCQRQITEDR